MNKKLIITLGIVFVVILTSAVAFALTSPTLEQKNNKPSDYKIGITYEEAVKSDKPMLALFYVDWCGYCLKFMPKYKTVSTLYKKKYNVVMLNAEDPANKALVEDVTLTGFPTLYIIDPKYDNRILLNNAIYQDLKKLRVELDRYIRIRSMLDLVPVK
ncbi:thioredoxin fold domain-containing protein [bacterium]|nr:thioredoxin fold domain-containing protein [bacterium]